MIAFLESPERSACWRVITPAWKRAMTCRLGGISLLMLPSMAMGTDNLMIADILRAYRTLNFRREKCFRDHGASAGAGGAREVGGPGVDCTPRRSGVAVVERRVFGAALGHRLTRRYTTRRSWAPTGATVHPRARAHGTAYRPEHHAPAHGTGYAPGRHALARVACLAWVVRPRLGGWRGRLGGRRP